MGYVAFTRFCRESGFVANTRFFLCLVQTFTQTLKILLRFCADICSKNWLLGPLIQILGAIAKFLAIRTLQMSELAKIKFILWQMLVITRYWGQF